MHEQRNQKDDRKRNSDKPKQRTSTETHDGSPLGYVVGKRTHLELFLFLHLFLTIHSSSKQTHVRGTGRLIFGY
jgi:hypothetical protein